MLGPIERFFISLAAV